MAYTIDDLNALVQAASGDELPIWDVSATGNEEPTKKITLQNLAAAIKTLASLLGTGDVVNNLTSTATNKPLSAAQGKALNDAMPKTMSISATTDGTGRFAVAKPIGKLVAVHLYDKTCYNILRYLDSTQTLVYVRNIKTNDPVLNTQLTGNAVYFD